MQTAWESALGAASSLFAQSFLLAWSGLPLLGWRSGVRSPCRCKLPCMWGGGWFFSWTVLEAETILEGGGVVSQVQVQGGGGGVAGVLLRPDLDTWCQGKAREVGKGLDWL